MQRDNWDDLRFVLAVAQQGSVSAAARALGVNHATVLRRIAAFEERHGSLVFDKTARGYSVPQERAPIIDAAREVEAAILAVSRMIEGAQTPLHGVVRVTSTDTFCHMILPAILSEFRAEAADLQIDLFCSNAHLDLARLDADITVRPAVSLPRELRGEIVAELGFAVYAARGDTVARDTVDWLGLSGPLAAAAPAKWLVDSIPPEAIVGSADSFVTLREMAAMGLGRAILPCILGDQDTRLARVATEMPAFQRPIWVASHADLAEVPRIRAVRQYLGRALGAMSDGFLGAQ